MVYNSYTDQTNPIDVLTNVDQTKWRRIGHLSYGPEKWSTNRYPHDGEHNRVPQHQRWEGELKLTVGPCWSRLALDRAHWKDMEEAYAKRDTEKY